MHAADVLPRLVLLCRNLLHSSACISSGAPYCVHANAHVVFRHEACARLLPKKDQALALLHPVSATGCMHVTMHHCYAWTVLQKFACRRGFFLVLLCRWRLRRVLAAHSQIGHCTIRTQLVLSITPRTAVGTRSASACWRQFSLQLHSLCVTHCVLTTALSVILVRLAWEGLHCLFGFIPWNSAMHALIRRVHPDVIHGVTTAQCITRTMPCCLGAAITLTPCHCVCAVLVMAAWYWKR
jgi:hypothetical protein